MFQEHQMSTAINQLLNPEMETAIKTVLNCTVTILERNDIAGERIQRNN